MKTEKEDRRKEQYFIDRDGRCHKFKGKGINDIVSVHYEIAKSLYPHLDSPDDALMKMGWVMIGSSVYNSPIIDKKPSQAQINKLHALGLYSRLCFLHNGSYPNYEKYSTLCED